MRRSIRDQIQGLLTRNAASRVAKSLFIPLGLILTWEIAVRMGLLPPSLSAAPLEILHTLVQHIFSGTVMRHASLSLLRILLSVTLGALAGFATGYFLARSERAEHMLSPTLRVLAPIPVVIWMPFAIMAFGSGEIYKVALALLATFFIVYIHSFQAVRDVNPAYLELAALYEKTKWETLANIVLPSVAHALFTSVRISLALTWIVIFFVEYGSSEEGLGGLGWFIADARSVGRVEDEYAGVLLLGVIGFLVDLCLSGLQRHHLKWVATSKPTGGS